MRLDPKGWTTADFKDHWEVVSAKAFPNKQRLQPPDSPPVQRTEEIKPVQIFNSLSGRTLANFGQNLVGWLRIRVQGATAGHTLSFTHTEVLEHGEVATRPLRAAKAKDTLILADAEPLVWEPKFTFHGFRYVKVDNWPSQRIDPSDLTAIVLHTDMERTGWFECSEPLLNKLHENVRWGMRKISSVYLRTALSATRDWDGQEISASSPTRPTFSTTRMARLTVGSRMWLRNKKPTEKVSRLL